METNYTKEVFKHRTHSKNVDTLFELFWFDSVSEVVSFFEYKKSKNKFRDIIPGMYTKGQGQYKWQWDKFCYEDTRDALLLGKAPEEFIDMVEAKKNEMYDRYPEFDELKRLAFVKKRKKKFSEDGAELNIDRYMSGEVEQWQTITKSPKTKAVKILFSGWVTAGYKPESFIKNAVVVAALVDILKTANISVELWHGALSSWGNNQFHFTSIFSKIKSADQPLDISRVLTVGLPGYLRYYLFAMGNNIYSTRDTGCGRTPEAKDVEYIKEKYQFDSVISIADDQFQTYNCAKDILNKILL